SFSGITPKDPVQKQSPFESFGTCSNTYSTSFCVLTTRGNPNNGNGGSSGWMVRVIPNSSATGQISLKKPMRFARKPSAPMSAYVSRMVWKDASVYDSSEPGNPA